MSHVRLPKTLRIVTVPAEHAEFAERRIRDHVSFAADRFNAHLSVKEQMAALALSCYLQGVGDGVQVAARRPEVIALFVEDWAA